MTYVTTTVSFQAAVETYTCHCFEEFRAAATTQETDDDALLSSLVDSHLIQDAKLLAKSPYVVKSNLLFVGKNANLDIFTLRNVVCRT